MFEERKSPTLSNEDHYTHTPHTTKDQCIYMRKPCANVDFDFDVNTQRPKPMTIHQRSEIRDRRQRHSLGEMRSAGGRHPMAPASYTAVAAVAAAAAAALAPALALHSPPLRHDSAG